ncbi:MAG: UDP-N-acetylglucosamine 1-carboxyvinyltransferase [Oscillospiraceae bacterium]|nr:UDP-N-acetylglucosamine 1-carboxyvinyltransferase [Oscillospiraceae bacterium]
MQILSVRGGRPLFGTVNISGAKNSVLPILAASVVCRGPCVLHNCPKIDDVEHELGILRDLGCRVGRDGATLYIDASEMDGWSVPAFRANKMRSSIIFLGAIVSRMRRASIALPGGCPLGKRPIDLHIGALTQMGAQFDVYDDRIECRADRLHGCLIALPFPSVGATENAILAALSAEGKVQIQNAALEPEITDLVRFLRSAGAQITGDGTGVLEITGNMPLHGTTYTVMPDRIETATFACAAAACGGDVTLRRTEAAHIEPIIKMLDACGCEIKQYTDSMRIVSSGRMLSPGDVVTAPYPGFPTDAQAVMMAAVLKAQGCTRFEETIFENRLGHTAQFSKMGAKIVQCGQSAVVCGTQKLHGAVLHAHDLRGGAALVIAALSAEGNSAVTGVKHIRRGYDHFEEKLQNLGADIECIDIFA